MNDHKFAVLSTGRRDGSPQASMVGYVHDRGDILVVFRRSSAKYHNIARQPRVVLSVPDGRRVLTVYGDGVLVEKDPTASKLSSRSSPRTACPRAHTTSSPRAWTRNSA